MELKAKFNKGDIVYYYRYGKWGHICDVYPKDEGGYLYKVRFNTERKDFFGRVYKTVGDDIWLNEYEISSERKKND